MHRPYYFNYLFVALMRYLTRGPLLLLYRFYYYYSGKANIIIAAMSWTQDPKRATVFF